LAIAEFADNLHADVLDAVDAQDFLLHLPCALAYPPRDVGVDRASIRSCSGNFFMIGLFDGHGHIHIVGYRAGQSTASSGGDPSAV
jgi:hypothetical protein